MTYLLILGLINSLICNGLYNAWQFEYSGLNEIDNKTKGVLWFYKFHFLDVINYRLSKPLGNCLTCMGSVFSFLPYWWHNSFDFTNFDALVIYPFYLLMVVGMNGIIDKLTNE